MKTAGRAIGIAREQGRLWLADSIQSRLASLETRKPYHWHFTELGDPDALRGKNKIFSADRGRPAWNYPHNWIHCVLPARVRPDEPLEVPIMIGEDLDKPPTPARIDFRVIISNVSADNRLSLSLNGKPLPDLNQPDAWKSEERGLTHMWKTATAFTTKIEPDLLKLGRNETGITVGAGEVIARAAEVRVSYDE